MEDNNITSKEPKSEEVLPAPTESEGAKSGAPKNEKEELASDVATSVTKDKPTAVPSKTFVDYLIGEKDLKPGPAANYNTYINNLKKIFDVCKRTKHIEDLKDENLKDLIKLNDQVVSAIKYYRDYQKKYCSGASDNTPPENPLQQIFYGAPGTGKSHEINELTYTVSEENVIRTTFHPDSDYSTFVGAYKPTTQEVTVMDIKDGHAVPVKQGESDYNESKIVYEFVEQSFLKAYIKAWKNYVRAVDGRKPEDVYLVIEEINRGNCAQIFGDLFQLLDRNDDGFSDYEIHADKDMQRHLQKAFKDLTISKAKYANEDVSKRVINGDILLLPNNLYIWATMNTSDQSLFPIDSAFKRRWDWKYVPITNAGNNWKIKADSQTYDWWDFLEKINEKIEEVTKSEDKQLGYFFCKPRPDNPEEISAETFVGKVIFYLWNDVFKDFNYNTNSPFKKKDKGSFSFRNFYTEVREGVNEATVAEFLKNLGLKSEEEKNQQPDDNGSASPSPNNKNSDEVSPENKTTDPTDNNNDSSGMPTDEE